LRVISLFSGAGGFDVGLERAGMVTVAQVEWDKHCQSVLRRHWPDVPKWSDICDVRGADLPGAHVVAFGSPCQDLSVAGKRAGMVAGETRSGLFYEAIRIIKELQNVGQPPAFVVWENVAGALSSNRGHDFAAVLDSLGELGAVVIEYRLLDAQWFGVPQRRRRVFVVARFDSGAGSCEQILPFGASVCRDSASSNTSGQDSAGTLGGGFRERGLVAESGDIVGSLTSSLGRGGPDASHAQAGFIVPDVVNTLCPGAHPGAATGQDAYAGLLIPQITNIVCANWSKGVGNTQLDCGIAIPFVKSRRAQSDTDYKTWVDGQVAPTLNLSDNTGDVRATILASSELAVRRLTPRECERLQGWPDDHTRWADTGKEIADGPRYRMIGNGVASPVAQWVGECIVRALGDPA
jgi:DNA (cytosine-5)-methyltransferase 1